MHAQNRLGSTNQLRLEGSKVVATKTEGFGSWMQAADSRQLQVGCVGADKLAEQSLSIYAHEITMNWANENIHS